MLDLISILNRVADSVVQEFGLDWYDFDFMPEDILDDLIARGELSPADVERPDQREALGKQIEAWFVAGKMKCSRGITLGKPNSDCLHDFHWFKAQAGRFHCIIVNFKGSGFNGDCPAMVCRGPNNRLLEALEKHLKGLEPSL